MSVALITGILFGGLLGVIGLGVPVAFGIAGLTVVLTLLTMGTSGLYTVVSTTYRQVTDITLITIPLFILMGQFLYHSGISDRLFQAASYWLSGVRGSLALVAVLVCAVLAMLGGFGPGIMTMGVVAVPAMLRRGYDKSLTLGSVMAGGVLGDLIPPSIIMIIIAYIGRLSLGRLFFGGIVPGIITVVLILIYIVVRCHFQPQLAPKVEQTVTWRIRWKSLLDIIAPVMLVLLVLGLIFRGITTTVEAAAIGALGALVCCFIYRTFTWDGLKLSIQETLKLSAMALWILIAATLFGVFFTSAGAQAFVSDIVNGLGVNRWLVLILMQVILLILGSFMDDYAIVTIALPVYLPIVLGLGFDPIWFAIIFVLSMQVAYLTPPFGWCLILMRGLTSKEIKTSEIWRSVPPFVGIQLAVLGLTMIFPWIALWLPGMMM